MRLPDFLLNATRIVVEGSHYNFSDFGVTVLSSEGATSGRIVFIGGSHMGESNFGAKLLRESLGDYYFWGKWGEI